MNRFDVRQDVPVVVAAVAAGFLVGLLCFYATREAFGGRAWAEIQPKSLELASLPGRGEAARGRMEELASEIRLLVDQVRDSSRVGGWVGTVAGLGFVSVSLVAHFLVLKAKEKPAGEPKEKG